MYLVSKLIDHTTCTWRHDMLESFAPMDGELIQSIPLCSRGQDDFWAWHYEKTVVFSVRLAYSMLVDNRETLGLVGTYSTGKSYTKAVKKELVSIWNVKVPQKKLGCSYGDWQNNPYRRSIYSTIGIWQLIAHAVFVEWRIHGDTHYWIATCLSVCGH